jgi:2-polyprenyl-3-methyl-5-hydroxy-6-metoxy-1,4-benzoquinol methylase
MEWQLAAGRPEFTTAAWYEGRERAPHLEQGNHRGRLLMTEMLVRDLLFIPGNTTVCDLGCGDGGLLSLLRGVHAWGYDLAPANVAAARSERDVDAALLDLAAPGAEERITWGDIVVVTEILEHLTDPHAFVKMTGRHAKAIVASSPAFETADRHYEFHTWAWDLEGYYSLITQGGFEVLRHQIVDGHQVLSAVRSGP